MRGQVLNSVTKAPVPFATLAVPGRNISTAADDLGRYFLRLPSPLRDTLVVTSVGFKRLSVPPAVLAAGQCVFRLAPQEEPLQNVVVEHRPVHPALLGQPKPTGDVLWMGGSSGKGVVDGEWGWELGSVLKNTAKEMLATVLPGKG